MSTTFPDPIIKPFSNTGDNAPPPLGPISTAANQETGFPILESTPLNAGGIPVTREEFNGTFNFYTKQILALVMGCRFTFNQAVSDEQGGYPLGAVLYCASNNSLQRSLVNNNTANFITTPSYINDGVNWSAIVIDDLYCKNLEIRNQGEAVFYDATNTHAVTLVAPTSLAANTNYEFPATHPTVSGQSFTCTTAGVTSWAFGALGAISLPSSGYIGETIKSVVTGVSVTGVIQVIRSINIPPGIWSFSLQLQTSTFVATSASFEYGISGSPTTFTGAIGDNVGAILISTSGGSLAPSIANYTPGYVPSTTTFYLLLEGGLGAVGTSVDGRISAIRIG